MIDRPDFSDLVQKPIKPDFSDLVAKPDFSDLKPAPPKKPELPEFIKPVISYLESPTEPPKFAADFIRVLGESAAKAGYGLTKQAAFMGKAITDPYGTFKDITPEQIIETAKGMALGTAAPFGFLGYQAAKQAWSTDPVGSAMNVLMVLGGITSGAKGLLGKKLPVEVPREAAVEEVPPTAPIGRVPMAEKLQFTSPVGIGKGLLGARGKISQISRFLTEPQKEIFARAFAKTGQLPHEIEGRTPPEFVEVEARYGLPKGSWHLLTKESPVFQELQAKGIIPREFQAPDIARTLYEDIWGKVPAPEDLGRIADVFPETQVKAGKRFISYETKAQAAKDFWKKGMRLSAGVDPTMMIDLMKVGGYYVESGLREFAPWSKKMIEDFGEGVEPYLQEIFTASIGHSTQGAPLPKYAGSINLERIEASPEAKQLIMDVSKEIKLPKETLASVEAKAETIPWTMQDIIQLKPTQKLNRAEILRVRNVAVSESENMIRMYEEGGLTSQERLSRLAPYMRLQAKNFRIAHEAGQTLGSFRIKAHEIDTLANTKARAIEKLMQSGKTGDIAWIDQKIADIAAIRDPAILQEFVNRLNMSKATLISDAVREAWINSLLSSPTTWVKVLGSQSVFTLERPLAQRPIAALIDIVMSTIKGTPRERYFKESILDLQGMVDAMPEALRVMAKSARAGRQTFTEEVLGKQFFYSPVIPGPLGKIFRTPTAAIGAFDDFTKVLNYRMTANVEAWRQALKEGYKGKDLVARKERLMAEMPDNIAEAARSEAFIKALQRPLSKPAQAFRSFRDSFHLGFIVDPFITVADSTVRSAYERSPFAIPEIAYKAFTGKLTQGQVADRLALVTIGSIAAGAVATLAAKGLITGGAPVQPNQRSAFYTSGRKPYRMLIGNKWVDYGWMEPFSTVVGTVADYVTLQQYMDKEDSAWKIAYFAFSRNLLNKTWMSGLSDLIEALHNPGVYGEKYIKGLAGTMIPQVVARYARTEDPIRRDPRTILEGLKVRIPGLSKEVPALRDLWGKPVIDPTNTIQELVNPVRISELINDPTTNEVLRIKANIVSPRRKIGELPITEQEFETYAEKSGQASYRLIKMMITTPKYQKADVDKKRYMIEYMDNRVKDFYRKQLEVQLAKRYGSKGFSLNQFLRMKRGIEPIPEVMQVQP